MSSIAASGIVLAGGAGRRFGGDKLAAIYEGRPLLDHALAAVAGLVTEVIVVLAPGDERSLPAAPVPVRVAVDPELHGGPLIGLMAGLELAREPIGLVVGGDMPSLAPAVLGSLLRALGAATEPAAIDAATLLQRGVVRPLPAAVRNGAATEAGRRLVGAGERSLTALFRDLRTRSLEEAEWRGLDPTAATLRDIDRPTDLER
jgi:molybdopterin-guanine dinucleotide biosynthesis protein A